jgi:hypothetical protein
MLFKIHESQAPVIPHAIGTSALMAGPDMSRGDCFERIGADFPAMASPGKENPRTLPHAIVRHCPWQPGPKPERFHRRANGTALARFSRRAHTLMAEQN